MEHVDRTRLYTDSDYRFGYVANFMEFGADDVDAIKAVADQVRPLVPVVVDAVYDKLFKFDITKKHFLPKNEGFQGTTDVNGQVASSMEDLTIDNPQIKFRKDFLTKYLDRLLSGPYDEKMLKYLDWVAKIHTDTPSKKSKISVDYIHVNALMGYVESTLVGGLLSLNLDRDTESKALLAFNKLLWLQNDFFAKYYCKDGVDNQHASNTSSLLCSVSQNTSMISLTVAAVAAYAGFVYAKSR